MFGRYIPLTFCIFLVITEEGCGCGGISRDEIELNGGTCIENDNSESGSCESNLDVNIESQTALSEKCKPVLIDGGTFWQGTNDTTFALYPTDGEVPERRISLDTFKIDACEVTNKQFYEFWDTEFREQTSAEKYGWSFVMEKMVPKELNEQISQAVAAAPWWLPVEGATFLHPEGPQSNITKRWNHPAVHISWIDAEAYCSWKGGRLPTEAEWEYAARGGLERMAYPWGNDFLRDGKPGMNTWDGESFAHNEMTDGHFGAAPVASFLPNGYGLYDMTGNVWEWVQDVFKGKRKPTKPGKRLKNPRGPKRGRDRVMKGGSFMCHPNFCNRYRTSARHHAEPDSSLLHLGVRCVYDVN